MHTVGGKEGRDTCCQCGKAIRELSSIQTNPQWCIVTWGQKSTETGKLEANEPAKRRIGYGGKVDTMSKLEDPKDFVNAKTNWPTKAQKQNSACGFRGKCVTMDLGVQVTTLPGLPCLPVLPGLPCLPVLPGLPCLPAPCHPSTHAGQHVPAEGGQRDRAPGGGSQGLEGLHQELSP